MSAANWALKQESQESLLLYQPQGACSQLPLSAALREKEVGVDYSAVFKEDQQGT